MNFNYLNPLKYYQYLKKSKLTIFYIDRLKSHIDGLQSHIGNLQGQLDSVKNEISHLRLSSSKDKLSKLKNKYAGKRCFILGNGPSLTLEDINRLKSEYTFASNKIFLIFDQTDWRPSFYSVEDHLVLSQNIDEIESVQADYKLFPNYPVEVAPTFSNSIFFPLKYVDFYPEAPEFSFDMISGLHWGSSIVYTQMQIACFLGFKEIYLLGVDYSYAEPSQKDGKILTCEGEVNHFHKDYRKPGEKWYVPNLHYHEQSFTQARLVTEANGIKIFNATRGGKLEIFPRIDFDSLF